MIALSVISNSIVQRKVGDLEKKKISNDLKEEGRTII